MEVEPYSQTGGYGLRPFGYRTSDYRRVWNAGRTIGKAVKRWLGRRQQKAGFKRTASGTKKGLRGAQRARNPHESRLIGGLVTIEGAGGQISRYTAKLKDFLDPSVSAQLAPFKGVYNDAGQLLSAVGKQNVATVFAGFSNSDLASMYADLYASGTKGRLIVDKLNGSVTLSNIYLSNVSVDIYDCVARKDGNTNTLSTPTGAWSIGDTSEGVASLYTKLGSQPTETDTFNIFWKVLQKTRIVLGAGQQHKHVINLDYYKKFSYPYLNNYYTYRDCTHCVMIVIHGAPANDSTTQTSVSLGSGGVNYVWEKEYHFKYINSSEATVKDHSNLATSFAVAEQVVNIGGTTITANAEG